MNELDTVPCYICSKEIDLDDSVWANSKGDVNNPLYAYCVPCLPAQEVLCGDHIQPIKECGCLL